MMWQLEVCPPRISAIRSGKMSSAPRVLEDAVLHLRRSKVGPCNRALERVTLAGRDVGARLSLLQIDAFRCNRVIFGEWSTGAEIFSGLKSPRELHH
jgi:hypothetical protein